MQFLAKWRAYVEANKGIDPAKMHIPSVFWWGYVEEGIPAMIIRENGKISLVTADQLGKVGKGRDVLQKDGTWWTVKGCPESLTVLAMPCERSDANKGIDSAKVNIPCVFPPFGNIEEGIPAMIIRENGKISLLTADQLGKVGKGLDVLQKDGTWCNIE